MAAARLKTFVAARRRRLRDTLRQKGLGALVVSDPLDVRYLTGFGGSDSVLVVAASRRVVLVTDSRFVVQARSECPGLGLHVRRGPMAEAVAEVCERMRRAGKRRRGTWRVGIDPDAVTVRQYRAYQRVLGKGLRTVDGLVRGLRVCKDTWEIARIRRAVRVAEEALEAILDDIRPGVSEQEVKARLEYALMVRGSSEPAFASIVAFGAHAAEPHALPGGNRLRTNGTILIDWGATVEGYRSDLTRTYAVGRIPRVFAAGYRRVLEAQLAAIDAVKPGARLVEVDAAARRVLAGSPGAYEHGTGHGVGLDVHEAPVVSPRGGGELRPGMVLTIEPGWYMPGRFGVRLEDDVLVTERGRRVLSRLEKSPEKMRLG